MVLGNYGVGKRDYLSIIYFAGDIRECIGFTRDHSKTV